MNIQGYAFEPNEKQLQQSVNTRYEEIEQYKQYLEIHTIIPQYAQTTYTGEIMLDCPIKLNERDIAILLDNGNLCFGAECRIVGNQFTCTIYAD